MADQSVELTVAEHRRSIAQINDILLLLAQRTQEHDRLIAETREVLQRVALQQEANTQQIAANAQAISELRSLMQDRYGGNGQGGDRS